MKKKKEIDNLDRVRRICLALPEAFEKDAWGEPTFRVKTIFAMSGAAARHGKGRDVLWCNAPEGLQEAIVGADPERFFVPPYMGVSGWIGLVLDLLDDEEIETYVVQSYCMSATKKLCALVGG
jgi:hypothetical protein